MVNRPEVLRMLREKYPNDTSLELVLKVPALEDHIRSLGSLCSRNSTILPTTLINKIGASFIGAKSNEDPSIIYKLYNL